MTTSINWPISLPSMVKRQSYEESGGINVLRTPVDAGAPKTRKLGERPDILSIGYQMTTAQVATFETFVKVTTAGVKRFNWTHPRTGASVEVRFVPDDKGRIYRVALIGAALWAVDVEIEVLP